MKMGRRAITTRLPYAIIIPSGDAGTLEKVVESQHLGRFDRDPDRIRNSMLREIRNKNMTYNFSINTDVKNCLQSCIPVFRAVINI
jgi:hypothetical protein